MYIKTRRDIVPFTERNAIEDMIRANNNQIKDLRHENRDLLQRLREIDERDMNAETSLDIVEHLTEAVGKLSDVIPHIPVQAMIEHVVEKQDVASQVDPAMFNDKPEKTVIEEAANEQKLNTPVKQPLFSNEKAAGIIKEILMDFGDNDVKAKKIENEFYKRTGKKYANFSAKLADAMDIYPNIIKAGKGYYRWYFEENESVENERVLQAVN
jgi:hypothetical protein